ncbi:MAG TPA: DMT family transporter [Methylomirabilota bacterium]|nr:DMT family transporter [Methylomirabilota bacterium]
MLFLVTVVVAWGLTWPVNKVILSSLAPLWAVAIRTALAALVLVVVASLRGRLAPPPRGDLPVLLSITLLHIVGFSVLSTWGLMRVPAGRSVVLAYTTPLWVIPGAWLFLGERLTSRRAMGVVIGLAGLLTLFNPLALDWSDSGIVLGHLAIVAAAMLWALSILHIRGHRWISTPFDLLPWETMLATVILVPLGLLGAGTLHAEWTPSLVLLVLYAGIPGSALAYWAVAMASRNLPAVTTSLGLLATPVVSVIAATIFLGEPLTPSLIVAIVLILGGVALGTAEA